LIEGPLVVPALHGVGIEALFVIAFVKVGPPGIDVDQPNIEFAAQTLITANRSFVAAERLLHRARLVRGRHPGS
jgi:hypothetical protein